MEPAIAPGDVVFVDTAYFSKNRPKVGDIVLFTTTEANGGISVKRIAALGPGTVEIKDAALLVDGQHIAEPHLKNGGATTQYSVAWGPFSLPEGCIFLLGDYRDHSQDSRADGCYLAAHLIGRVDYVAPSGSYFSPRAIP
jgi:signal peptidase I